MRKPDYVQLVSLARRCSRRADEAEDLVHDALLVALSCGRGDLGDAANRRWVAGVVRNAARMQARTAIRRKSRDAAWLAVQDHACPPPPAASSVLRIVEGLSSSLRAVAALALSGHNRREIAYLLRISDDALRQRIHALRREFARRGAAMPEGPAGLTLDLPYGRLRQAMLPGLRKHGGVFASHDPDGHLFYVKRSQNA
jgi:DNA-directed RNA polymerase specialized sigma24 family protein